MCELTDDEINSIRDIVADGLNSRARFLDRNHVVVRVHRSKRVHMLGDMEIEVFSQFYIQRFFSRDLRAKKISGKVSSLMGVDCATWINMSVVGYARVTVAGEVFSSD
jgi:hypothetical protein